MNIKINSEVVGSIPDTATIEILIGESILQIELTSNSMLLGIYSQNKKLVASPNSIGGVTITAQQIYVGPIA